MKTQCNNKNSSEDYVSSEMAPFLARLFSKKTSMYCHSPGVVVVRRRAKALKFSNISVITEDIYLKLRIVVDYQKGNPHQ